MYLRKMPLIIVLVSLTLAPALTRRHPTVSDAPGDMPGLIHNDLADDLDFITSWCTQVASVSLPLYTQDKVLKPGENVEGFVEKERGRRIWVRPDKCGKAGRWDIFSGGPFSRCTFRGKTIYAEDYQTVELGERDCCDKKVRWVRITKAK
jgi:hypothetical protein